jgi:hypothetical protein
VGPPSINWIDQKKTSGENRTGRKRCQFLAPQTSSKAQRDDPFSLAALFGPPGRDKVADRARSALHASVCADTSSNNKAHSEANRPARTKATSRKAAPVSKADRAKESRGEPHAETGRGSGRDPRGATNNPMGGLQAPQGTGNAATHPAHWGGGTRNRSWDDDSHDTPPAPTLREDGGRDNLVDCNKEEDSPAKGKERAHNIVAETLKALAGDKGGLPALNVMRLDLGHDVGARAIAALRDNNLNVDPNNPSTDGCDSSLALEESEGSDLSNSWDSSNVDPDNPYGGGCGSSLGSEEVDAHDVQDPTDYYGGGSDSS